MLECLTVGELKTLLKNYDDSCLIFIGVEANLYEAISACPNDLGLTISADLCNECEAED